MTDSKILTQNVGLRIDPAQIVGAVTRTVVAREHLGKPARVVVAERSYATDREDLWDALTSPTRIPRWFLPVSGDLKPGGRYQIQGNASGTVLRCDAPEHLGLTWEFGGDVSWVEVTLRPEGEGTALRLEHVAYVDDDRWGTYGPGAVGVGWDLALMGLELYLSGDGSPVDPGTVAAWTASAEGHATIRGASDAWGAASIAGGTEPAQAQGAAERTRAFYTGTEPEV